MVKGRRRKEGSSSLRPISRTATFLITAAFMYFIILSAEAAEAPWENQSVPPAEPIAPTPPAQPVISFRHLAFASLAIIFNSFVSLYFNVGMGGTILVSSGR